MHLKDAGNGIWVLIFQAFRLLRFVLFSDIFQHLIIEIVTYKSAMIMIKSMDL